MGGTRVFWKTRYHPADQEAVGKGPIPEGEYTLNPGEISHVTGVHAFVRNFLGDWGNYRVPLHPAAGTNTHGRSGFFLHGGKTPGSASCIDVCELEKTLFPLLLQHQGPINVFVNYPKDD